MLGLIFFIVLVALCVAAVWWLPFVAGAWWENHNKDLIVDSRRVALPGDKPGDAEIRQLRQLVFDTGTRIGRYAAIVVIIAVCGYSVTLI